MVAVKVTVCPAVDGFGDEVSLVAVGSGLMTWVRVPVEPKQFLSPV